MSVNVYDSVRDELNPLTSAFANLPIIDVATLPSQYLVDAIYRVASDNWVFSSVELSASDMTENVTNLEAIGFATNVDGDEYTFTPATSNIRYLHNDVDYSISSLTINSVTGEMNIYNTALEPLFIGVISTGALYPFYYSEKWSVVNILLSHTDMDANTEAFTNNGFTSSTDNVHFTYIPAAKRFKYDGHQISKIIVTSTDGNMKMYDEHDEIIYNAVIVDGAYTFTSASAVTYWVGNKAKQTADQLAKIDDIRSFNSVSSLQDIFNSNPAQVVSGNNNNMMFVDDSGNKYIGVSKDGINLHNTNQNVNITPADIEVSHQASGSKVTDFKVNATKITLSNTLKEALKTDLDIYTAESMITGVEEDAAAASKAYVVNDLLIREDVLYKVIASIDAGDTFVVGTNISAITIEDLLKLKQNKILDTPLKIDSETANATTVEGALGLLNQKKLNVSLKGAAKGLAELNESGKVPATQLPSYVDDVIEGYYNEADGKFYEHLTASFDPVTPVGTEDPLEEGWYEEDGAGGYIPTSDTTVDPSKTYYEEVWTYSDEITGETGKIYIDLSTEKSYRWSGTVFINIGSSLALGETSDTAYRGDRGKIAYDDSQTNKAAIAKILADIASVDAETATATHAIDDLVLVNNQLYKVTTAISIGDTIAAGTNVVAITLEEALQNKLDSWSTLPTASATYLGKIVHYKGTDTTTLVQGYIYKCVSETDETTGDVTYKWEPTINLVIDDELDDESINPVQNKVVKEAIDKKQDYIFRGTHDEWEALTTEEKAIYDLVAFTDDTCVDGDAYISGAVTEGDYNAVSSDAVFKQLKKYTKTLYGNARLSSIGWYRVAALKYCLPAIIEISHSWSHEGSSSITLLWDDSSITVLSSKGSGFGPLVDDFRIFYDSSNSNYYLDIHYNLNSENSVWTYITPLYNVAGRDQHEILNYENVTSETGVTYIETIWENPPLVDGVEYKTTKRFNGKPVYTMRRNSTSAVSLTASGSSYVAVPGWTFPSVTRTNILYWHSSVDLASYHDGSLSKWATLYPGTVTVAAGSWLIVEYVKS